ncbi:hypothetical protein NC652_017134 [Populus alba x Populus x berolinensis]|nr:hypothetical protein NC652_017134 [Populus alba x Populus x berolinensis]
MSRPFCDARVSWQATLILKRTCQLSWNMKLLLSGTSEDYLTKTVSKFVEGRRKKVYVARFEYRSMKGIVVERDMKVAAAVVSLVTSTESKQKATPSFDI